MRPDFILKNVMAHQTSDSALKKSGRQLQGKVLLHISAISYPGVREIDGKGRYMLPGSG